MKVFKKTILAKMLMDSGNLVSNLISREFADLAGLQYEPERKKVGTAAKGGSVSRYFAIYRIQGCGSAYILVDPDTAVFLSADPDQAASLLWIPIQLKKLLKKFPLEKN